MGIYLLNAEETAHSLEKKYEIVKINGKYYIELDNFDDSECMIELSISLATENDILRERIHLLEEKLRVYSSCYKSNGNLSS